MPAILVVDDNELNRQILVERLTDRGYLIREAADGADALDILQRERFDLVVLDIMMPGLDGITVLQRIRANHSITELPVIMATARGERSDIVEALTKGANDYVVKPLDFAVATARIETQLALKRANDEIRRLNERIAHLTESSHEAMRDIGSWSAGVAQQLADEIGVDAVDVWLLDGPQLWSPHGSEAEPPALEDLAMLTQKKMWTRDGATMFAITGLSGDIYGAVVATGKRVWQEAEQRMLSTFARQLGGALELQTVRNELAAANARVEARRQEMIERGVDILQMCPNCGRCYDQKTKRCTRDGWALDAPRLLPYRVRNRYRFVRAISSGGMSTLFEAFDESLDRAVALKLIKPEHFHDPAMRSRFEQEARAVARIDHPGVVAIFDSGDIDESTLFFVMELLRGMNLGQALRRFGRGAPRQVASLARQLGAAVAAAHRAGFIHRDIKPDNIFLTDTADGFRLKLLDFGITKPIAFDPHVTQTGTFIGTPAYMSPEQLRGGKVDVRADIYSLGAVIYEALSGARVAPDKLPSGAYIEEMLAHVPKALSAVVNVPAELEALIGSALAKDAALRPTDAETWTNDVAALLDAMESDANGWPTPLGVVPPEPPVMSTQRVLRPES